MRFILDDHDLREQYKHLQKKYNIKCRKVKGTLDHEVQKEMVDGKEGDVPHIDIPSTPRKWEYERTTFDKIDDWIWYELQDSYEK